MIAEKQTRKCHCAAPLNWLATCRAGHGCYPVNLLLRDGALPPSSPCRRRPAAVVALPRAQLLRVGTQEKRRGGEERRERVGQRTPEQQGLQLAVIVAGYDMI